MNHYNLDSAILLFTNDSHTESRLKSFTPNNNQEENKTIAQKLINHTVNKLKQSGIPYYIIDTNQQVGTTFGQKLANATQHIFDKGYQKVIVVGNDCPTITPTKLNDIAKLLTRQDVIIGPTNKGGTYLIGITAQAFHKQTFENLPWQTKHLLTDLISYSKTNTKHYTITDYLNDINTVADLIQYINTHSRTTKFAKVIASFF